ncbi:MULTISPECIES: quinone oxidoreductase family protein [Arthrobacter]|uniref:NADPH:quinone reductase n=1 Tax=Arthrobacter psychrochitiniphilus TaxID=291045 RepID=A0A2V3DMD6_9MICC|nr:quinone oxidoreductase [Arthrobacter psychrochitiniphilus]NYG17906.1 NADPH2:quinone reductase [Arthrobacter psychrochitiniphilus]PXA64113.1 NADPH:quinone reductase [Arthrobacter psychrochitiniphilus]
MRTVVIENPGNADDMVVRESLRPVPGAGEILVQVEAAGVNFIDIYRRSGAYPVDYPHVPGLEGAGVVIELGDGVRDFELGTRVAWVWVPGSYAEMLVVPVAAAILVESSVDSVTAAAGLLQGMTAQFLTDSTFAVSRDHTLLVHAAAGGVGLMLTQLAAARGARVIGTVSSDHKKSLAHAAGAEHVIRYDLLADITQQLPTLVRDLTGGVGVDVVYDGVGATTFDASLASLKPHGLLVLYGQASGPVPPLDLGRLNTAGSLYVTRPNLRHFISNRSDLEHLSGKVMDSIANKVIDVQISRSFPLDQAPAAHRFLESRQSTGKVVLTTVSNREHAVNVTSLR